MADLAELSARVETVAKRVHDISGNVATLNLSLSKDIADLRVLLSEVRVEMSTLNQTVFENERRMHEVEVKGSPNLQRIDNENLKEHAAFWSNINSFNKWRWAMSSAVVLGIVNAAVQIFVVVSRN